MHLKYFTEKSQGDRPYMEDVISIKQFSNEDSLNEDSCVPTNVFAIFDGHGGVSAAKYAAEHMLDDMHYDEMWELSETELITSIQNSFLSTHHKMNLIRGIWPRTIEARPSNSGTTASIVSIHKNQIIISHVGDSTVIVAKKIPEKKLSIVYVTDDHKPNLESELARIESCGGSVAVKKGVHRVVWTRKLHQSADNIHIPFLALSRSLGDLWSYNEEHNDYIVSPKPDVKILNFGEEEEGYIVIASDGLWNMLTPTTVITLLEQADSFIQKSVSPATMLMEIASARWTTRNLRADNISIIVIKFICSMFLPAHSATQSEEVSSCNEYSVSNSTTVVDIVSDSICSMEEDGDENKCPKFYLGTDFVNENEEEIGVATVIPSCSNNYKSRKGSFKRWSDSQFPNYSPSRRSLLQHENPKSMTPNYMRRNNFRPNLRMFKVPTTPEEKARYWRRKYRLAP